MCLLLECGVQLPLPASDTGLGCEEIAMLKAVLPQASWSFFLLSLGRLFLYLSL